ncbi:MAG: DUF2760 domain-containing protein [Planctomycetes bacterium]|nr:DUF2760 domain-containing protein [Planctomycetota bacterium]
MRLLLAFRVFFRILFDRQTSEQVRRLVQEGPPAEKPEERPQPAQAPAPAAPSRPPRSEALTLLAALQREARLLDFVMEPLDGFSDAEVGAAARDVHRDCGKVLQRWFAVEAISDQEEGSEVELRSGFDAACYRLVGNVSGEPPYRGRLMHHGWKATRCETPTWTGDESAARVISPIEVEVS